ncbi:hypothetical protein LCGC14_2382220 [marine sediment metagenome]|uniref:Uncharacterized protein n=1 Tax=marine sediment metagenome TaxID=412755 RepID=A0A0F9EVD8_9ZZZZ
MTTEQPSKKYDARQELKYFSILLRRAVASAMNIILGFLSSITSIPQKSISPSVDSSPPATAGPQKSFAPKSESVKYYVQTATENTPSSSKTITPTPRSAPRCVKSIKPMELGPEGCEKIREGLIKGTIDLTTISVAQWLHVSYLALFAQKETHMERAVVYEGNVYNLHLCVSGVMPPEATAKLKHKQ